MISTPNDPFLIILICMCSVTSEDAHFKKYYWWFGFSLFAYPYSAHFLPLFFFFLLICEFYLFSLDGFLFNIFQDISLIVYSDMLFSLI